jgi:GrpB-like predicted nucleotidyltransferase (UPF0157 family)/ribosomal protein S18 acetylase RimI-like enzyme
MKIRSATSDDADAIACVQVTTCQQDYRCTANDGHLSNFTRESCRQQWSDLLAHATANYQVAVVADDPAAGVCGFAIAGAAARSDWGRDAQLYAICVLPTHQRRGLGRLLCRHVATRLLGARFSSLITWALAADPALKFYESLGGRFDQEGYIEVGSKRLRSVAYVWRVLEDLILASLRKDEEPPVRILPYDETWPALFEVEREVLTPILSRWLFGAIEHIGSTAVPGLCAKPVIDMMAPVESLYASREALGVIADAGYEYVPYTGLMHWFCKPDLSLRTHHLQLVPYRSRFFRQQIAFRDCLLSDPAIAREYAELKHRLAAVHRFDRDTYTKGKAPFVARSLASWERRCARRRRWYGKLLQLLER